MNKPHQSIRKWSPAGILICSIVVLILCIALCIYHLKPKEKTPDTASRMEQVQEQFYQLALMLDELDWVYLQRQPVPDWMLRNHEDKRLSLYNEICISTHDTKTDKETLDRFLGTKTCYHFDLMALFPKPVKSITQANLSSLRKMELQSDPFAPDCYFGYISVMHDYALISVGPDGDNDILGFSHDLSGRYHVDSEKDYTVNWEQVYALVCRNVVCETDPIDDPVAEITIDCNKIYDPTNGVLSNGDIVFHRSHGSNFMFDYLTSYGVLDQNSLKRKELKD